MAIENIIEMTDLVKTYKIKESLFKKRPFNAIDHVSLSIKKGEIFGLLGTNGAGKTTLIKIMAGLLEPNEGAGSVLGFDIYQDHKQIRGNVSLVAPTADVGTDNNLTVRQNLEFWAVVYNLPKDERQSRIDYLLNFLDLKQYESAWPMSISAGMRQKLAIARSLLVQNPILFLDEPTVKLDAKGAESIRDFIKIINKEFNTTIVLTTHYIFEAEELCERVAIMDKGRILSCDTVDHLRKNLQKYDVFIIRCDALSDDLLTRVCSHPHIIECEFLDGQLKVVTDRLQQTIQDTTKLLRHQAISIYAINTSEYTLEDIFIKMTTGQGEKS